MEANIGKVKMTANVRLVGYAEFPFEVFEEIVAKEYDGNVKALEKQAKQDFIRAMQDELGFKKEDINVTKFSYEYIHNTEEEGVVNEG